MPSLTGEFLIAPNHFLTRVNLRAGLSPSLCQILGYFFGDERTALSNFFISSFGTVTYLYSTYSSCRSPSCCRDVDKKLISTSYPVAAFSLRVHTVRSLSSVSVALYSRRSRGSAAVKAVLEAGVESGTSHKSVVGRGFLYSSLNSEIFSPRKVTSKRLPSPSFHVRIVLPFSSLRPSGMRPPKWSSTSCAVIPVAMP